MGEVLGFISIKGGVGKTTLALETASSLANDFGKKVLLVDGNFSSPNLGLYFGLNPNYGLHDVLHKNAEYGLHNMIQEKYGMDIVPASIDHKNANKQVETFALKKILIKIKGNYDYVIIDSSPHHSELLPVVAASDRLFVVTTPDHVTLYTTLKAVKIARSKKTPIDGIIINKIKNPDFELGLREIEQEMGVTVVAKIKDDKKLVEALFYKTPITIHSKEHHVSREIRNFASSLCGMPEVKKNRLRFFMKLLPFNSKDVSREKINRYFLRQNFYERQFREVAQQV